MSILLCSIYDQYDFGSLYKIDSKVMLADLTRKQRRGIVKDVLILSGQFYYLVDFMILDYAQVKTNERPNIILLSF